MQSDSAKGGDEAPVDVPWQDEDFARISRIDAKQNAKRRKRKAAPKPKSANAKPTTAEPPSAVKAATPTETPRPPLHRTQVPRPADGPALTTPDAPAPAETTARRDRNPERRLDPPPFPFPPEKERKEDKKKSAAPVRPAAASPTPADESFTGPRLDPPNRRPSQAPVTEVRNIRHGAGPSLVSAGLLLFAAVGVSAVLVSQMTADLPSKVPNLVSSTEPSPVRQPLDQTFTDKTAPPRAAQPQQEHEIASLPPPAAASGKVEKSVPPAADVRSNDPDGEAAKEEPGTVEAEPETEEQQRAVSQPPAASGEAAPQSAERSSAPRELASAEATLELPEAATPPSPAGSEIVAEVQTRLSTLGYAPGPADGALREQTRDAIRAFQTDAGLPATGEIDGSLVARLRRTEQVHWRFSG